MRRSETLIQKQLRCVSKHTRNFKYQDVHATGAATIAKVAAANGVPHFVHVSHLNASPSSKSAFYQTKAEGEKLVKEAFPNATIVRPAAMYGYEDKFFNNIHSTFFYPPFNSHSQLLCSAWPIWWKLNGAETKIRPVHVRLELLFL